MSDDDDEKKVQPPGFRHLSGRELLALGNEDRIRPALLEHWYAYVGVPFGVISGVVVNWGTRRPYFSGIHKHFLFVVAWVGTLRWAQNYRDAYSNERDAMYLEFIKTHPCDFEEEPRRVQYKKLFEPWIPIR